jgi:hypothetical protein
VLNHTPHHFRYINLVTLHNNEIGAQVYSHSWMGSLWKLARR